MKTKKGSIWIWVLIILIILLIIGIVLTGLYNNGPKDGRVYSNNNPSTNQNTDTSSNSGGILDRIKNQIINNEEESIPTPPQLPS